MNKSNLMCKINPLYEVDGEIKVESGVSEEKAFSLDNLLQIIYENGKFYNLP